METIQKYIELARLICKRRLWGLNGREAEQLEAWLKENPRDKSAFKNLQHIDPEGLADRYEKIDIDRQWKNFQKRTAWRTYIWWRVGVGCCRNMFIVGNGLVVLPASPSFSSAGNCSNGSGSCTVGALFRENPGPFGL